MAGSGNLVPPKQSEQQSSAAFSDPGPVSHAINGAGMEHQLADSSSDAESSGISEGNDEEDGGVFTRRSSPQALAFPVPLLFLYLRFCMD